MIMGKEGELEIPVRVFNLWSRDCWALVKNATVEQAFRAGGREGIEGEGLGGNTWNWQHQESRLEPIEGMCSNS